MVAGTDTTTTLIEWAMTEILKNHSIMKRIQEELDPFGTPEVTKQTCMVGGYTIPKGCTVFINVWAIQRNPGYWDNPLELKLERFLTNEGTNKRDFSGNNMKFLPFGSGRRLCPGYPLAEKMQMYILSSLLQSFNWTLPNGEEHNLFEKLGITLRKTNPLIVIPSQRLSDDPVNFKEAVLDPQWCAAMDLELKALANNGTWELTTLSVGKKVIGSHWLFKTKLKADGTEERNKARLVIQGNIQRHGVDYQETFAPVAKLVTVESLLAVAALKGWDTC
nr:cytochrome P450 [Tanacetum cinerariifolium]